MKLNYKTFATPATMLQKKVVRSVVLFVNQCETSKILFGDLHIAEYALLDFIGKRIEIMLENPDFGGNMGRCLDGYKKILPNIKKLLLE